MTNKKEALDEATVVKLIEEAIMEIAERDQISYGEARERVMQVLETQVLVKRN